MFFFPPGLLLPPGQVFPALLTLKLLKHPFKTFFYLLSYFLLVLILVGEGLEWGVGTLLHNNVLTPFTKQLQCC